MDVELDRVGAVGRVIVPDAQVLRASWTVERVLLYARRWLLRAALIAATAVVPLRTARAQIAFTILPDGTEPTGIRGDTVTATDFLRGGATGGLLYNLSTGSVTPFPVATPSGTDFPGASESTPYGPTFGSQNGILEVVGSYKPQSSPYTLSYLYDGAAPPGQQLTTLAYPRPPGSPPVNTFAHSTFGNQVVGNYFGQSTTLTNAFIYDISTGTYVTNDFPGAVSTTAYGVWGDMIAGSYRLPGEQTTGYTYNEETGTWTSYNCPGAIFTDFHGISGAGRRGTFNLGGTCTYSDGHQQATVLHISANGSATWIPVAVPGATLTAGTSIYGSTLTGGVSDAPTTGQGIGSYKGFVATIPGIYNPIQNTNSLNIQISDRPAITAVRGDDVVNDGTIQTSGANSAGIQSGADGVITNNGSITVTGPGSAGVLMNGSYGTLINTGSITAAPGGYAIQTGPTAFGPSIINDGTINGQIAITAADSRFQNSGWLGISAQGAGVTQLINGVFVQTSGGTLALRVAPNSNDMLSVTGTALLSGAVQVTFASGSYVTKQYQILQSAGLSGTTFTSLGTTNLPANFNAYLSYSATDAFLNLTAVLGQAPSPSSPSELSSLASGGITVNQQNVATALNSFFNSGGALPPNFVNLFGLTGSNLGAALTQLDGEVAVDSEFAAFQMMDQFLNLMLDPFVDGRLGSSSGFGAGSGQAMSFAPDSQASLPPDVALAYASILKAPPPAPFAPRWTAWGASYGGGEWTNGNAAVGSNNVNAQTFGFVAGMDYHYSPDTIFGFALAGGGANWGLSGGLGSGHSDAFQTGVYGITHAGPAYLAVALAFTNHWMTTTRAALGDELTASFAAQSYGGRVEAGYRFAVAPFLPFPAGGGGLGWGLGVTPYAALQAQDFHAPSYSETDVTGGGFGLAYNAMNAIDTRTELGARFDDPAVVGGLPLVLRARIAWAHDFVSNPEIGAVFQSLPGASFTVNGAPIPQNSALTSAGAELYITPHVTLIAKFEGEFAPGSQTYAGSGTFRYTW